MTALLEDFVDSKVQILTHDGKTFIGNLSGFDQATNLILTDCAERVLFLFIVFVDTSKYPPSS